MQLCDNESLVNVIDVADCAQAALAHKYRGLVERGASPSAATDAVFDRLGRDYTSRRRVMELLDNALCVTFAAPMPFSPRRPRRNQQQRALEWLDAHAINYCAATDIVPHLPRQGGPLVNALPKWGRALPVRSKRWRYLVRPLLGGVLRDLSGYTSIPVEIAGQYRPLAPTILIGPDEPVEGTGFSADRVTLELDRFFDEKMGADRGTQAIVDGFSWHMMSMLAPHVIASLGVKPPRTRTFG